MVGEKPGGSLIRSPNQPGPVSQWKVSGFESMNFGTVSAFTWAMLGEAPMRKTKAETKQIFVSGMIILRNPLLLGGEGGSG